MDGQSIESITLQMKI